MTPEIIIERCLDEGVDVIAITDHNETSGAVELLRKALMRVIVGEEIRCAEGGAIIGLFLEQTIRNGLPAKSVMAEIRSQGGLVYLPHPFDVLRSARWPSDVLAEILPRTDILETFNARTLLPAANARAAAAAQRLGMVTCAGADAHLPSELGRTYVLLPPWNAPTELLESLRRAHAHCERTPLWARAAT